MASRKTAVSLALGTAFAASLATVPLAHSADNPFGMDALKNGYQVAENEKGKEGTGAGEKGKEGNRGGDKKKEGKCGEGKCGGNKAKK